ncbi:unnamed protein product [Clonostachys rhizophaga]|uniref:Amine oxidase domain-containing protein n=1 Tax=Clonostachys rhizophaga TaxID=160324 RepID=A0A9N9VI29_9HYPO|nr:unnamed protein product [Clonostachys rhizophaga]
MDDRRSARLAQLAAQNKMPRVGVIGAGISGLRSAQVLLQKGFHVTVLEARDRIGGRRIVVVKWKLTIRGANWIHGMEKNPIGRLAAETDTVLCKDDPLYVVFDTHGRRIPDDVAEQCGEFVEALLDEAEEYSHRNQAEISPSRTVRDFMLEEIAKSKLSAEPRVICEQMVRGYDSLFGDPLESQSLKFLCLQDGHSGEDVFVASTYKGIVQSLALEASEAIRLNQEVVKITTSPRTDDTEAVTVETKAGLVETFDEVVMTCPIGWLQRNKDVFNPRLPPQMEKAVDAIGFGDLEKILVSFPTPFWDPPERKGTRPPALSEWNFLSPRNHPYGPELGSWTQMVVSLSSLPSGNGHPTLLFYICPPLTHRLMPILKGKEPHSELYNEVLREFTEPFYSLLPNYDADTCRPASFLASQWLNDPFAYGSYSNARVTQSNAEEDFRMLRTGGGKGKLGHNLMGHDRGIWFAGEHTNAPRDIGTTTGAWASGDRAAKHILLAYGLKP